MEKNADMAILLVVYPFVRQFMRGLTKKKATKIYREKACVVQDRVVVFYYGMCRIKEVLILKRKDVSPREYRPSGVDPNEVIEYGTYALFNCKNAVAEGRTYNAHQVAKDEQTINAYVHMCNCVDYASLRKGHLWGDDDFVFPALKGISKKVLKTKTQLPAVKGCPSAGERRRLAKYSSPWSTASFGVPTGKESGPPGMSPTPD
ncbi:hypothetical protein GN958_ATG08035 [Phytophthora infestans]|uniref:Uncharacterized protein n=1 Tax=Phytophthora infestans TaxID=4787 RepID=A0A8S9UT11_PHYIN|nr:hypothetical protein GN958_ATG08035 [Phytophthora infestans]